MSFEGGRQGLVVECCHKGCKYENEDEEYLPRPMLEWQENYKEGIEAQCCVKRECMKKNKCEKNISLMAGFIGSIRA